LAQEAFKNIKQDQHLGRFPVVVLTSSKAEQDGAVSYDLHPNFYILKP
jgi:chemotaxis family two-component system response regulator Rcp1|tara:strand:+ start:311 stop:454 length:144 start_codon:yes stop_codon:yes gene_type:complete